MQGICDSFAAEGYLTVMPDFYGHGMSIDDVGGFSSPGGKKLLQENNWCVVPVRFLSVDLRFYWPCSCGAVACLLSVLDIACHVAPTVLVKPPHPSVVVVQTASICRPMGLLALCVA